MRQSLLACLGLALSLLAWATAPAAEPDAARIAQLIRQLGSERFAEREAASRALEAIGGRALDALHHAAATDSDLEVRRRAGAVGQAIEA